MARDISRIRSRIILLFAVTTLVATGVLVLVAPIVHDLTTRATRNERLNFVIFGSLLMAGMLAALHRYLRPISDLGHALEIGSAPSGELVRRARRIAFNGPVYFLVLPVVSVFLTAVLSDVFGILVWPDYVWAAHFPSTLLTTVVSACGSLVVSLVTRQWMRPVLLYTAPQSEADGHRLSFRNRLFLTILPLTLLAVSLTGILGFSLVVRSYRERVADQVLLALSRVLEVVPDDLTPEEMLQQVTARLPDSIEYEYLFVVDSNGEVLSRRPIGYQGLEFDSELWLEDPSERFRQPRGYFVLAPAPSGEEWWVGAGFVVHPLRAYTVSRAIASLGVAGGFLLLLAAIVSHYLASDLVTDLRDVTARLASAAQKKEAEVAPLVPVLSRDEVGDLVRAYNALQRRMQMQQEEVEREQRQLATLQSLSYKIGTSRDVDHLLREVVQDVERAFGYHNVSVLLVDEQRQELYFAVANHVDAALLGRRFKIGEEGIVGHVAATGEPMLVNNVSDCRFYIADRTNTRAEMAVPLRTGAKVIGVFNVSSERIGAFDEGDLRAMVAVAAQMATAIENARLLGSLHAGRDIETSSSSVRREDMGAGKRGLP